MAILGFELEEIIRLVKLLETSGMEELFWEEEDRSIRIRGPRPPKEARSYVREVYSEPPPPEARPRTRKPKAISASALEDKGGLPADQVALTSPMVGTFYRAEKPGASPLIEIGQHISIGQTIGVIEAMKVFSEIPAEQAGTVVAIPAQDGQLVQSGAPLIILRRD